MEYKVGDKIKFKEERNRYTIQACNERFLICTKPYNPKHTVIYTIVDLKKKIRGTDGYVFCLGYETREDCEEALEVISKKAKYSVDGDVISSRNRIKLRIDTHENKIF